MRRGFTLIEVLVAVFLLTVGAGAAFALLTRTASFTTVTSSRLVATHLAQEGVEITRNIRDSNWLANLPLDAGISAGDSQADFDDGALSPWSGTPLQINDDGLYWYGGGEETAFVRTISVDKTDPDAMVVDVKVFWTERGREHEVTSSTKLYNWLPQ